MTSPQAYPCTSTSYYCLNPTKPKIGFSFPFQTNLAIEGSQEECRKHDGGRGCWTTSRYQQWVWHDHTRGKRWGIGPWKYIFFFSFRICGCRRAGSPRHAGLKYAATSSVQNQQTVLQQQLLGCRTVLRYRMVSVFRIEISRFVFTGCAKFTFYGGGHWTPAKPFPSWFQTCLRQTYLLVVTKHLMLHTSASCKITLFKL